MSKNPEFSNSSLMLSATVIFFVVWFPVFIILIILVLRSLIVDIIWLSMRCFWVAVAMFKTFYFYFINWGLLFSKTLLLFILCNLFWKIIIRTAVRWVILLYFWCPFQSLLKYWNCDTFFPGCWYFSSLKNVVKRYLFATKWVTPILY